jgi:hypothetical protein
MKRKKHLTAILFVALAGIILYWFAQGGTKGFADKDSPPYLHDGRLLTLEDTVEFFNVVSELKLNREEKAALVAFMRAL